MKKQAKTKSPGKPKSSRRIRVTPVSQLRIKEGMTLDEAAKKFGISPAYLRRIELRGGCSYVLALKMSRYYGCSMLLFL